MISNFNIMKKYKKTLLAIIVSLFTNLITFAQTTPADIGDPADTNPLDTPAAPIDSHVWLLALVGLLYILLKFRAKAKQKNSIL
jgi:hypothetical protein